MSKQPIIQDTISFNLDAETTITNQTVKITAQVAAVIDGATITNDNLADLVRDTLNNFVAGEWSFSNPTRETDETGYERASYTATVRVDQSENHNLEERADDASTRGLRITSFYPDTSTPKRALAEAESTLRTILLQRAANQARDLSTAAGRTYRVHGLSFSNMHQHAASQRGVQAFAATANYSDASAPKGGGAPIGHTHKVGMNAQVILATAEGTPTAKQA